MKFPTNKPTKTHMPNVGAELNKDLNIQIVLKPSVPLSLHSRQFSESSSILDEHTGMVMETSFAQTSLVPNKPNTSTTIAEKQKNNFLKHNN